MMKYIRLESQLILGESERYINQKSAQALLLDLQIKDLDRFLVDARLQNRLWYEEIRKRHYTLTRCEDEKQKYVLISEIEEVQGYIQKMSENLEKIEDKVQLLRSKRAIKSLKRSLDLSFSDLIEEEKQEGKT